MEALIVKLATSAGGAGVAIAAMYFVYKMNERRKANTNGKNCNPMLGGTNPAGDERSGVAIVQPEAQPVTRGELNTHCKAVHAVADERFDTLNKSLGDTNTKIDRMETKLDTTTDQMRESVGELKECVAVIKDRSNRGV